MPVPFRVVLDTNILLRGLLNMHSAAGAVLEMCDQRFVVLLLSSAVVSGSRAVLTEPALVDRYPELLQKRWNLPTAAAICRR